MSLVFLLHLFPPQYRETSYDEMIKIIENVDASSFPAFIEAGCVVLCEHKQFEFLFVPAGAILVEMAMKPSSLVFGLRKPLVLRSPEQAQSYTWLIRSYTLCERPIGKMNEALELMKVHGEVDGDQHSQRRERVAAPPADAGGDNHDGNEADAPAAPPQLMICPGQLALQDTPRESDQIQPEA